MQNVPQSSANPSHSEGNWTWNFWFCGCFFLSPTCILLSLAWRITQKVYDAYEWSSHQMTALLSEIHLSWVRAACKLQDWRALAPNTHLDLFLICYFFVFTHIIRKLQVVSGCSAYWWLFPYRTSLFSHLDLLARHEWWRIAPTTHHCVIPIWHLFVLTCTLITLKARVIQGNWTYRMTALLSKITTSWVRAAHKIQQTSYGSKHASVVTRPMS